jgi:hypothetical protein
MSDCKYISFSSLLSNYDGQWENFQNDEDIISTKSHV